MAAVRPESAAAAADAAAETTPLLAASQAAPLASQPNHEPAAAPAAAAAAAAAAPDPPTGSADDAPLPVLEIAVLCLGRFMEAVAFFSIVPFINQMVKDNSGLTDEEVPAWSGIIESLFSLTQMLLMIQYGRAADYFGRKAVLLWSLAGLTVTVSIFGLAKTIPQMILFRCLSGCFGGVVVIVRTMLSEKSTKKTQGQAFSIFAVISNIGIFVGPLIGGALANPVRQYPSVFGHIRFFHDYPYALPSFVTGALAGLVLLLEAVFVTETLHKDGKGLGGSAPKPMSVLELVRAPGVAIVLFLFAGVQTVGLSYTAMLPAFLFTPVRSGGIGFDELHISLAVASGGIAQGLWMLLVFTPLQRRYSTGWIYRWCTRVWALNFVFLPACNLLLRNGQTAAFHSVFWAGIVLTSGVAMTYTAGQLTLNDVAPTPQTLGTLNGISLSIGSGVRAVGPAAISAVYSIGIQKQILWGYLAWLVLLVMIVATALGVTFYLPAAVEGDLRKEEDAPSAAVRDGDEAA